LKPYVGLEFGPRRTPNTKCKCPALPSDNHEENTVVTPSVTQVAIIKRVLALGFTSELSSVKLR